MKLMQEFNLQIQYVKDKDNTLADSLSHRPFLIVVFLVKWTMIDTIKGFYGDDVFSSTLFESLSKDFKTQKEIYKFSTYVLDADILHYKSRICIQELKDHKKIIMIVIIFYLRSSKVLDYICDNKLLFF